VAVQQVARAVLGDPLAQAAPADVGGVGGIVVDAERRTPSLGTPTRSSDSIQAGWRSPRQTTTWASL
jgi:hypothetical protein